MAGQTVTGNVTCNFSFQEKITTGVLVQQNLPAAITQSTGYNTAGTAAGQGDTLYGKPIALAASTPQTIDLTNLTDPAGNVADFARVREIIIQNLATTAAFNLHVYQGATTGWAFLPPAANPLIVVPGGMMILRDPLGTGAGNGQVTTATSKTITLDPGTNAITVNVLIMGGSAP